MSRKTYHHLSEGDEVTLEAVYWGEDLADIIAAEVPGRVVKVHKRRVSIAFLGSSNWGPDVKWEDSERYETVQMFSRQSGQLWGARNWDFRIHGKHAKKKE